MKALTLAPGFHLPLTSVTATFGLLAVRGAGKSNTAAVMAEEMFDNGLPFVVIDPVGSWYGLRSGTDGTKVGGIPIPIFGGRHGDLPLERGAGELIADLVTAKRLSCVLDLSEFASEGDKKAFLLTFARRLYQKNQDPLHLFLEEADDYIPQRPMRDEAQLLRAFENIVRRGRARGLGITLITQRSAAVNKSVLTQIETLFAMRTTGPQDIAAIEAWVKYQQVDGEVVRSLSGLFAGEAWVWSPHFLQVMNRIQVRRRRTFDSGATPKNVTASAARKPATLADVDLKAIQGEMLATIEKAKADDPKALRAQLAEVRAELAKARSIAPSESPGLTASDRERVDALLAALNDYGTLLAKAWAQFGEELRAAMGAAMDRAGEQAERTAKDLSMRLEKAGVQRLLGKIERLQAPARETPRAPMPSTARVPILTTHDPARTIEAQASGIKPMHRAMLTALAQHGPLTRKKIRAYTGYADSGPVSSAFGLLVSEGWVVVEGDRLKVTAAGLAALGPWERLPTGAALRARALEGDRLSSMEKRFMAELFKAYPETRTRGQLREACGYADSGPVSSAFGHLVAIDYAVAVDRSGLKAADVFFEESSR